MHRRKARDRTELHGEIPVADGIQGIRAYGVETQLQRTRGTVDGERRARKCRAAKR